MFSRVEAPCSNIKLHVNKQCEEDYGHENKRNEMNEFLLRLSAHLRMKSCVKSVKQRLSAAHQVLVSFSCLSILFAALYQIILGPLLVLYQTEAGARGLRVR